MKKIFVDLHTHTNASDGTDSPADMVRRAAALGLGAVAVTDHDTLAGLDEAEAAGRALGVDVVRGCEISTRFGQSEVHIVGLWLPREAGRLEPLKANLAAVRAGRAARNRRMAGRLAELGLPVTYEAVRELAAGGVVGRPHFAALLCRLGVTATPREAFDRYLGSGGAAYVPRHLPEPAEAVAWLNAAGATVCLAHPRLIRCAPEALDDLVASLVPCGLNAIEAYHSEHSAADVRACVGLARRHGLLLSGGSDYHGAAKPGVELGRGRGGLRVTSAILESLRAARHARGLE
ncbi:MAG: PHP domain-containing protein [Desulfovibrionaceae bacterium]|nr:PHP domain-containing protein [Desulfovibrionaceae bacterium]